MEVVEDGVSGPVKWRSGWWSECGEWCQGRKAAEERERSGRKDEGPSSMWRFE